MAQGFTSGEASRESGSVPDFSGSRNAGLSNTGEIIAQGAKEFNTTVVRALDSAIKIGDEAVMQAAKDDARAQVEGVQEDTRKAFFNQQIMKEAVAAMPERTSQEIADKQREMQRLTDSYEAGAITPTHYWSRLDSVTRNLRARFPGYRDEIDKVVSSITGGKPANEVISQILHEAAKKAPDPNKEYNHWFEKSAGVPEVAAAIARGERPDLGFMQRAYAIDTANKAMRERAQAELTYASGQNALKRSITEQDKADQFEKANTVIGNETSSIIDRIAAPLNLDRPEIKQAMDAVKAGKASSEQLASVNNAAAMMRAQGREALRRYVSGANFGGKTFYEVYGDVNKANGAIDAMEKRIDAIADGFQKGDHAILSTIAQTNKLRQDSNEGRLLDDQVLGNLASLRKMVPEVALTEIINTNKQFRVPVEKSIYAALNTSIPLGTNKRPEEKTFGGFVSDSNSKGRTQELVINQAQKSIEILGSSNQLPETRKAYADFLFGDNKPGSSLMDRLEPGTQRDKAFSMVLQKNSLDALKKLESEKPGTMETFRKWMEQNGTVHIMHRMGDLNAVNAKNDAYQIVFSENSGRFEARPNAAYKGGPADVTFKAQAKAQADKLVSEANGSLAVMRPGLEMIAPPKQDVNRYIANFIFDRGGFQAIERKNAQAEPQQ